MTTERDICVEKSKSSNRLRRFSFPALLILLGISTSLTFADDAMSQSADFDIPPQSVESALHEFSRQADVQVMVGSPSVEGQRTSGVKGRLSAASALTQLLKNTNLTYETVGDGDTITVKRVAAATSAESTETTPEQTRSYEQSDSTGSENRSIPSETSRSSDDNKRARGIEEVIVTAQKREERLQDVPISISVLSGIELDKSSAQGVTEALNHVPGVTATTNTQGGNTLLSVRGVTASGPNFNGSSPIAYYLDAIPFGFVKSAFAPDANAYDLERVEVLRGPQGTLYGASAQNGVVRVLTHGADLNEFELKARASASNTDHGGNNSRIDSAVNVPIVPGKLAARFVVGYQDLSGWIDKPNDGDANSAELRNVRLNVKAQPIDNFSIDFSSWLSRSDYDAQSISDDDRTNSSLVTDPITNDYNAYGLRASYQFSGFSISSMTGYLDYFSDSYIDFAQIGIPDTRLQTTFKSKVLSQEVLVQSAGESLWEWSVGGMYRDARDRLYAFRRQYLAPTDLRDFSKSLALFGEVTRQLFDRRLELTGGLRYFEDDVTNREVSRLTGVPASQLIRSDASFDAVSPRVVLTWHPSDAMTVYTSYAEGFRSGFPQNGPVLVRAPQFPPLDADNLKNYELGTKGSFWNGRITVDAAVFYIDWQDVQQTLTVNVSTTADPVFVTALVNAESASGMGVEFGMRTEPVDGLSFGLNFSWNDLTFDSPVFTEGSILFGKGDRLNLSPEYTAGAYAGYAFSLGQGGYEGSFSVSANYSSELAIRELADGVSQTIVGDAILVGRTEFSLDSPNHWGVTLFVDNVNNEDGSPIKDSSTIEWSTRLRPRTIGLQLDYRF